MLSHRLRRAAAGAQALPSYSAKSLIIDIADNYGGAAVGLRSVDFFDRLSLIINNNTLSTSYSTTGTTSALAFDTSLSKIGSSTDTTYVSGGFNIKTNQRLINVLDNPASFTGITINNSHSVGAATDRGSKNVKIYISTDPITDTTYGAVIPNSTLIFDGILAEHIAADSVDDQILTLIQEG